MIIKLFFVLIFINSCSQNQVLNNKDEASGKEENTVEVAPAESNQTAKEEVTPQEGQKSDEFVPYTIKANRNKFISVFLGKLEDRMFYAIGIIKWFERHGYKIKKVQTTSSEEDQLFSILNSKKKTSLIEWRLHQCCKDEFPLKNSESYKEVIKDLEPKVLLPDYAQDRSGCIEYANENSQDHVLCIVGDKKLKIETEQLLSEMNLIIITLPQLNYGEQLSLVDYIDQGYSFAQRIKN